jgi:hypothetical protein
VAIVGSTLTVWPFVGSSYLWTLPLGVPFMSATNSACHLRSATSPLRPTMSISSLFIAFASTLTMSLP